MFELALPVLLKNPLNRCLQTQIQKTNVLIHLALSHCILPHFIPCFICTRSRKQQKNMFSPARNSAGNTRGSLRLHCSQSLQRMCPKKLFEQTLFSITTFCFVTLCSTSPVQLYARDHKYLQKTAWRRSTQRAKSEARALSSSNQRAKQSRALRKNCSEKQLQFTMICFAPRRSASLRARVRTGSPSAQGRTQGELEHLLGPNKCHNPRAPLCGWHRPGQLAENWKKVPCTAR